MALSNRYQKNLTDIIAKVPRYMFQRSSDAIDLSFAENHVIRKDVHELVLTAVHNDFKPGDLDWPKGIWGDAELLELLSGLFNSYFKPCSTVEPQHLVVGPGAAACLDALIYNICDTGNGVLVPCPYWNGYDNFLLAHTGVTLVPVNVSSFDEALEIGLIHQLDQSLKESTVPIRALIISNPHNPLGRCYDQKTLAALAEFCTKHQLHLISDEVFALSVFDSADLSEGPSFTSVLSLDETVMPQDLLHVVWSFSKDLAFSGARLATIVTRNSGLRNGAALIGSFNVATMVSLGCKALLQPDNLRKLTELSRGRLSRNYALVTDILKEKGIVYFPANSTTFLLAKLAPKATSPDDEIAAFLDYSKAGVILAPGHTYHLPDSEHGWFRICFAVDPSVMAQAMAKIVEVYGRSVV